MRFVLLYVIFLRLEHPLNAQPPILVTPPCIVTLSRPEHPLNANAPILFTLLGIVTLSKSKHPLNTQSIGIGIFLSF